MSQITDVSVIGLGAMGWGAAVSLLHSGYTVHGVDLREEVLTKFADEGGKPCSTPADVARDAAVVMTYVVNDEQTEDVLFGTDGAVSTAAPGTLFINSSTMTPSSAARIGQKLEDAGMQVLDAPITGGAARALRGEVTVMVAGTDAAFEIADPILDAVAARVLRLGDSVGQASQIKMINQLLCGVHIAATAEAMTLAAKIGVDLETMYQVVTHTTGNSWMFEDRGSHIVNGDYEPRSAIDIILKDLGIVHHEAEVAGSEIPMTTAALGLFAEAAAEGYGREDGSAVAKLLGKKSGAPLPRISPP